MFRGLLAWVCIASFVLTRGRSPVRQVLDLESNCVKDTEQAIHLGTCSRLWSLTLTANPVCRDLHYRRRMVDAVPQLASLDEKDVSGDANCCFAFAVHRRHRPQRCFPFMIFDVFGHGNRHRKADCPILPDQHGGIHCIQCAHWATLPDQHAGMHSVACAVGDRFKAPRIYVATSPPIDFWLRR